MRIDAYNMVNQIYKPKAAGKVKNLNGIGGTEHVEISQFGKEYQIARKAVAAAPDVREDKVASLKASMNSNTYEVNEEEFADKLIEKYYGKID